MVSCQRHPQDWGLPARGVGPHDHRQQVKPRFIDKDNRPLLLLGFFLRGPVLRFPVSDRLLIALGGPRHRFLQAVAQFARPVTHNDQDGSSPRTRA